MIKEIKVKIVIVGLIIGLIANLLGCATLPKSEIWPMQVGAEKQAQQEFSIYRDKDFTISYPSDWMKEKVDREIAFAPPLENVCIFIMIEIEKETLGELTAKLELRTKKIDPDFKLISLSPTKLSGYEAYQIIGIGKCGNKKEGILHKSLTCYTVKDGKLYVISYHAEPDKFDDYLDTINKIMESFKIK